MYISDILGDSLVAQIVKNQPAMLKTKVQSLGWEDPLHKGMATHFNILSWRILWTEESSKLQSIGLQRVKHDWVTNTYQIYCYFVISLGIHQIYIFPSTKFPLFSEYYTSKKCSVFHTEESHISIKTLLKFLSLAPTVMPGTHSPYLI